MPTQRDLTVAAKRLAGLLAEHDLQVVFAESCTGGLVSAALTRVPGVSAHHCGSAVVYQVETKAQWLDVPRELLQDSGSVSREVAAEMAERVLARTPQADLAAAVTGHLGPDAPSRQDGLVYVAVCCRDEPPYGGPRTTVQEFRLDAGAHGQARTRPVQRRRRQVEAAVLVLSMASDFIASNRLNGSWRSEGTTP